MIATINDPHEAWTMLESSYGSQQSGIQAVINAELTLAKWDGQTPITTHRDHMKALRTRLAGARLTISPIQFYNHFVNSLPADYDIVVAIHDPIPTHYSIDTLCERFRAIELQKELCTTSGSGTADDPVALLSKQKRLKGGSPMPDMEREGVIRPMARQGGEKEFVGDVARRATVSMNVVRRNRRREDRVLGIECKREQEREC